VFTAIAAALTRMEFNVKLVERAYLGQAHSTPGGKLVDFFA